MGYDRSVNAKPNEIISVGSNGNEIKAVKLTARGERKGEGESHEN